MLRPPASSDPPARPHWGPVTIRVAWELVLAGLTVRPEVLAEAREHVLRGLPAGVGELEAEELASAGVADWLLRVREGRYRRTPADGDLAIPLSAAWRHRLREALDPVGDIVLRLHHGDGFGLPAVARSAAIDPMALEVARGGIREAMRVVAVEEGLPVRSWPLARLDALIGRVARLAEPGCPGPGGLLTEEGRAHADLCPRCSRAVRLVRAGVLSPADLFPPEDGAPQLAQPLTALAVLLHPDARRHQALVAAALGEGALPMGGDAWLLPTPDLAALRAELALLAEAGTPARHHLRGALVTGSGRVVGRRVLGPLPLDAVEAARARPWGEVEGLGDLPLPLPPPPRATRWWLAAGALAGLAAGMVALELRTPALQPVYRIEAGQVDGPDGARLWFDTDDLAVVDLVVEDEGRLEILAQGARAGKGAWATGDGRFQVALPGRQALVVASVAGIPDLADRVAAAQVSTDPLAGLAASVLAADPVAAVWRTPPPELARAP